MRKAMSGGKEVWRRWTMRRIFRWIGIIDLIIVVVMAAYGAYGLKTDVSPKTFFLYWSVFFILLMAAIVLAMFDALATMARFKKEHEKLRGVIRDQLRDAADLDSKAKQN
jgi:hypothetical protein